MEYTEQELQRIKAYEQRTGEEIIMPFERKLEIYRTKSTEVLEDATHGIRRSLFARAMGDVDDRSDTWKPKILEENLSAIEKVLEERKK